MDFSRILNNLSDRIFGPGVKAVSETPQKRNFDTRITTTKNVSQVYSLYTEEFSSLTVDRLKYYFECARLGMNFWKSLLFEEIRKRDLHIGGVLQTRKRIIMSQIRNKSLSQLVTCDWEEGRKFIVDNFSNIKFANFLSDIIEAEIQGVSVFEKIFRYESGKLYLKEIPLIPNHLLLYDDIDNRYMFLDDKSNDAMELRTAGIGYLDRIDLSRINTIELPTEKILEVHSLDGNSQNGFLNGMSDSLMWCYFFKSFSLKDWSIFLELYAMPARIGKYDSLMTNKKDFDNFCKAVENFSSLYWAVTSKDNDIQLLDSNKTASSQVYDDFISYWDTKASIRVLGNNITAEISKFGSNAALETAHAISSEIADSDILLVEDTVNTLIADLINLNYANPPEMPKFKFPQEKSLDDMEKKSRIYVNLNSIGYKPVKEEIEEEFDVKLEESISQANDPVIKAKDIFSFHPGKTKIKEVTKDMIDEYLDELWETAKEDNS